MNFQYPKFGAGWEQYDHVILGNTVQRPGGDAAVVRVNDGPKALALTTDVTERPEIMGQLVGCIRGIVAACTALLVAKGLASEMARSDALMLCAHSLARASDRLRRR